MSLINQADLLAYAELKYNVLFEGKHGVGKTAIITQTFNKLGFKWMYFSASTLDPWVDLIGVPKAKETKRGDELTLVRPSFVLNDDVDAIFFDELNRAPDKVLNAVMELIQFKSINGYKLKKLKMVWAAINPWDEENTYAVNEMDPALEDRFEARVVVPYKVDEDWFTEKYPDTSKVFCSWWRGLEDEVKNMVSPRRLAFAAHAYSHGVKLTDILPAKSNIKKLKDDLNSLPFLKKVEALKTEDDVKKFLRQINNVTELLRLAKDQNPAAVSFLGKHKHHVPKELLDSALPPAAAKKLNHEPTMHAWERLMRTTSSDPKFIFNNEAAELFKTDLLYQVELLTNSKYNIVGTLVEELKRYKLGSKAAATRIHDLVGKAIDYLSKVTPEQFNAFDKCMVGMFAGLVLVDNGEQFTKARSDFLAGKLGKMGGANCTAMSAFLSNPAAVHL